MTPGWTDRSALRDPVTREPTRYAGTGIAPNPLRSRPLATAYASPLGSYVSAGGAEKKSDKTRAELPGASPAVRGALSGRVTSEGIRPTSCH